MASAMSGYEYGKRADEVFSIFLTIDLALLIFVRIDPKIRHESDWILVMLITSSAIVWAIGHVLLERELSVFLRLVGWLSVVNQTVILVVFSRWPAFQMFFGAQNVRMGTLLVLCASVVLWWYLLRHVYPTTRSATYAVLLLIGLAISVFISCSLIWTP